MDVKKVLIISGPTACGKTDLSLKIHQREKIEIVNFDSLLFYRELNIGTAKPSEKERELIPHHMVNISTVKEPLNAARFCEKALPVIKAIHQKNKVPILVGGSGFYLKALLKGMYPSPSPSRDIIEKSQNLYSEKGIEPFIKLLKDQDPISAQKLHPNDHYRIIRAVQFFWTSGYPISEAPQRQEKLTPRWKKENWTLKHIHLNIPKEEHYPIIKNRIDNMLKNGLINEVKNLLNQGFTGKEKPLNSIGYKETLSYLRGELNSLSSLKEAIFISTRRLAKAQRTWFKTVESKKTFHPLCEGDKAMKEIQSLLKPDMDLP